MTHMRSALLGMALFTLSSLAQSNIITTNKELIGIKYKDPNRTAFINIKNQSEIPVKWKGEIKNNPQTLYLHIGYDIVKEGKSIPRSTHLQKISTSQLDTNGVQTTSYQVTSIRDPNNGCVFSGTLIEKTLDGNMAMVMLSDVKEDCPTGTVQYSASYHKLTILTLWSLDEDKDEDE